MRIAIFLFLFTAQLVSAEPPPARKLNVPDGFNVTRVAASPLVERPVVACFDNKRRLYVADSSGSNEAPKIQLEKKPHRVMCLEDTDGDGTFDKSTVFADQLSFLQGVLWYEGSLYVGAPPYILKLTDTDGDGKADKREIWFDGKTLTGCANDLHGPYLGPDGYFYWTKGAFAKQDYAVNGKPWTTKAAHIFRAKPDGSNMEPVMTGGMDNPVEVVFNTKGDLFFNTTFFQHPANGQRDGLIHNIHGAVYGKEHEPVYGHPWTSPSLMPPMTHLGPAAPSGLHYYTSSAFGPGYTGSIFCTQFNLRTVSMHQLIAHGSTYITRDTPFVTSEDVDFHPTDVLEDTDGSLLVIDTGGWYKLCCPSSQMIKADVSGGIYRVKRKEAAKAISILKYELPALYSIALTRDKAGFNLAMDGLKGDLYTRRLAAEALGRIGDARAVPFLLKTLEDKVNDRTLDHAYTFALIEINAVADTRKGLENSSPAVVRAALAALHAMPDGKLTAEEVVKHLNAPDGALRDTAWWIAGKHPEWNKELRNVFSELLRAAGDKSPEQEPELVKRISLWAKTEDGADQLGIMIISPDGLKISLAGIAKSGRKSLSSYWCTGLSNATGSKKPEIVKAGLEVLRTHRPLTDGFYGACTTFLPKPITRPKDWDDESRLMQLSVMPKEHKPFALLWSEFGSKVFHQETDSRVRQLAVEIALQHKLMQQDFLNLITVLPKVHPADFPRLLSAFAEAKDREVGQELLKVLSQDKLRTLVRIEQLKPIFDKYPEKVKAAAEVLYSQLDAVRAGEREKLQALLKELPKGDARHGQQVFDSAKANCKACHKVGYVGGSIGPDMTRIGSIRTETDLLEAIVYPSASFVRSYEPVKVTMKDGRVVMGLVKNENANSITLVVSATETVELDRAKVDEVTVGTISIMPAGLDQQLTKQELADLVAYLRGCK